MPIILSTIIYYIIRSVIELFFIATLLSSDAVSSMHPASSKCEDRESILLNDEEGMVQVSLEDPWVLREDFKPRRSRRACGKCERNYLNSMFSSIFVQSFSIVRVIS